MARACTKDLCRAGPVLVLEEYVIKNKTFFRPSPSVCNPLRQSSRKHTAYLSQHLMPFFLISRKYYYSSLIHYVSIDHHYLSCQAGEKVITFGEFHESNIKVFTDFIFSPESLRYRVSRQFSIVDYCKSRIELQCPQ